MKKRIWFVRAVWLAAFAAIAAIIACGSSQGGTGGPKPKLTGAAFDRDCKVRGGHPVTVRKGHDVTKVCEPPAGGWQ